MAKEFAKISMVGEGEHTNQNFRIRFAYAKCQPSAVKNIILLDASGRQLTLHSQHLWAS